MGRKSYILENITANINRKYAENQLEYNWIVDLLAGRGN